MEAEQQQRRPVRAPAMRVRLVGHTAEPYATAVASARTCYARDFVFVGRLGPKGERQRVTLESALPQHKAELDEIGRADTPQERRIELVTALGLGITDPLLKAALAAFADLARQRAEGDRAIAASIYEAGHHTPFQHPTFIFALENVSRNVVESFLHNHIFYNSEQQSQRYVGMEEAEVHVPPTVAADPRLRALYEDAVRGAWDAYHDIRAMLVPAKVRVMAAIGKLKGQSPQKVEDEAEKKAQEMARYVLPVAAHTKLYHTVSGIVLLRYLRMCEAQGTPDEARELVERMLEEVARVDPAFVNTLRQEPRPRGEHLEWRLVQAGKAAAQVAPLQGASELLHATPGAGGLVAAALREVTGTPLPEGELLGLVMDPGRNPAWNDTLNTWDHSPVLRTLRHVHLTFRKRLSLTAYAQDQRHRLTPGSRPLLQSCLSRPLDVVVPDAVASHPEASARFRRAVDELAHAIAELQAVGVPAHECTYLLPNATAVTYTQSGDLLAWIHKWRLRLCFNAQKEIFDASLAELRQAQAVLPALTRFVGPPCSFVAAAQPPELQDSVSACCPEGPRWCGVKVWQNFDAAKGTPKRPY
ncbi:MAG TPA: FAD-dependent thymidylate synthase [Candidatus Thermoplasmatota archaeon]|nr:FAD-dependent thymidylate synthase [Candidatus Thermoplasmatota archaeon]